MTGPTTRPNTTHLLGPHLSWTDLLHWPSYTFSLKLAFQSMSRPKTDEDENHEENQTEDYGDNQWCRLDPWPPHSGEPS
jgi:hypothetical protein